MADWTSIPDATFDPDRPVLGSTHLAIVKNFEALAEGASGAPRVLDAALGATVTTAGIDWVLERAAGASNGAVGTYAWLGETATTLTSFGGTRAGSNLRPAGITADSTWATNNNGAPSLATGSAQNTAQSGTWRCMGVARGFSTGGGEPISIFPATLWLRIS